MQLIFGIRLALYGKRRFQLCWNFNIVITIDAKNIFHNITGALHIRAISRNAERQAFSILFQYVHFQTLHDIANRFITKLFTNQVVAVFIFQTNLCIGYRIRIYILYLHGNLSTCQLTTKDSSLLECVNGVVGVDTTFKPVRRIRRESVAASALSNPCWMEICTFKYHIGRGAIRAGTFTTENTGNTHRLLRIANT